MKVVKTLVLAAAIGLNTMAFADENAEPTPWDVAELKKVQDIALNTFKAKIGEEAYKAITGFSIERKSQPTSATAKVIYKNAEGVKVTETMFCHVHGDEGVDCH